MIGPEASAFGFAFSSSSASATSRIRSSRSSRFCFCFAETSENCVVAAPLLGLQALGGELGLDAVRVGVGQVDLVDGDDDRHLGRARVRDRLLRLRHDAVVGGDDEHGDVRHLRAAGAHGGERLVARRVEERDLPAVDVDLVRADVLRDPAGLGLDDRRLADRVEQRRLAVVDVAHDRDDRRPRREILLGVLEDLRLVVLVGGVLDRDLAVELGGDQLDLVVGQRLRDLDHLPRPIMILMIWAARTPSACEKSRTVTPDGTVTGPVGGATGCASRFGASRRSRAAPLFWGRCRRPR